MNIRNTSHSSMKLLGNCVEQVDMQVGACLIDAKKVEGQRAQNPVLECTENMLHAWFG